MIILPVGVVTIDDKKASKLNYKSILENTSVSALKPQAKLKVPESENYYVRGFIDFAREFGVKKLDNVLINGYELSEEILATGKGELKMYYLK